MVSILIGLSLADIIFLDALDYNPFFHADIWLKDYNASAHLLWSLIGQDILNSDIGCILSSILYNIWYF